MTKNLYHERAKGVEMPNTTAYQFMYERTKPYMNYTALSIDPKKKVTYEELHEKITSYAKALSKIGIKAGDKVGVCLGTSAESIYVLYALWSMGVTMVGLSAANNEFKMQRDLEVIQPDIVISLDLKYPTLKSACDELNIPVILYSPIESMTNPLIKMIYNHKQKKDGNYTGLELRKIVKQGADGIFVPAEYDPNKVTDILFTGGSSGIHKGVDLNENGINCTVVGTDYVYDIEPGMRHLGNLPFGHMAFGRFVLHFCMCRGLDYVLTPNMLPDKFTEDLIKYQVHAAAGGPVHWENLINNPLIKPGCFPNLISATSGGEFFKLESKAKVHKEFEKAGCDLEVGDGLGLTEMWAPTHICIGKQNTIGTVGWAIPGIKDKIVDVKTGLELPDGQEGLLLVSGPQMMVGYHNNQAESDKVFSYDENGVKWYNTGDIAKRLETGEIQFTGREKRNFVSGVDNIYPEQVEEIALRIPAIKEIIVTKIPDAKYQFLPKYHINLSRPTEMKDLIDAIAVLIQDTLGEGALPGYIEIHDEKLPRTDNGKLNATLLQEQDMVEYKQGTINKQQTGLARTLY